MSPDAGTRKPSAGDATRQRLMESAERLVAARGVDSVSVRDITNDAGANSASIHYHFRSKEGLLRAVLEYRSELMRDRRSEHLSALGDDPGLEEIIQAMVRPTFDLAANGHEDEAASYVAFIAALLENEALVPVVQEYFEDQFQAYVELVASACPGIEEESLVNRLSFGFFLVFNAASRPARGLRTWISEHDPAAVDRIEDDLVGFITGGLREVDDPDRG